MNTIKRLGALTAMAALALSVAACGSSSTTASSSAPAAPPASSAAASDGVTTASQVFGAACSKLPQGDAAGSLNSMGPAPVATAASTNPLLKSLTASVKSVPGLVDTLNSAPALTVYAPADDAFAKLGDAAVASLLKDPAKLAPILQYHVVGQRYDKDGLLKAGSTKSLTGGTVKIAASGDTIALTDAKGGTATVLCGNIPTKNATVFVIDSVMMS